MRKALTTAGTAILVIAMFCLGYVVAEPSRTGVSAPVPAQNVALINQSQCPADSPLAAPRGFSSPNVRLPGEPTTAQGYANLFAALPPLPARSPMTSTLMMLLELYL